MKIQSALLSVSNKENIIPLARALRDKDIILISTGGTHQYLLENGIDSVEISELTQFPEMMKGRVKSLHPKIFGGILGQRTLDDAEARQYHIQWIDLVIVNLYPFESYLEAPEETAIEKIDIGGTALIRAAAKNKKWVGVVTDSLDYDLIMDEVNHHQRLSAATRNYLAQKAFFYTARYDSIIAHALSSEPFSPHPTFHLEEAFPLRYGENPHQNAYAYKMGFPFNNSKGLLSATVHQGKPLSYNNLLDADAALACIQEFTEPTCVIVKHTHPCAVASASPIKQAWELAFESDSTSAFGGIIALNQGCTQALAHSLVQVFLEVIIAPAYDPEALRILAQKPNLRLLEIPFIRNQKPTYEFKSIQGGLLIQESNLSALEIKDMQIATQEIPSIDEYQMLLFAWRVVKHLKSNAIVVAKENVTLGIGTGQTSRIDAVNIALKKAGQAAKGSVLASDAFFPFRDSIDQIAKSGVKAIIQPGGSLRDAEVIEACNEHHIAMVFTHQRSFKH